MTHKTCSSCEQMIPQRRLDYLASLHKAIVDYHSNQIPHCDTSTLEVLVRIDGKVVEIIPPEAFESVCDDEE